MDSARIRRTSSPPRLPSASHSLHTISDASDVTSGCRVFESDVNPSRQQKLLNNRNARFPAKKLSITGLGNKLSQLISNNEKSEAKNAAARDQENSKLHKSKSTGTIGKRRSLGVLEEISTFGRSRSARRRGEIPIYQDHPEAPLLQSSPSAPSPYIDPRGELNSPLGFDHIQDTLSSDMRLRERPSNVDWSPAVKSPTLRSKSRKRSQHGQFDADDYIEHIEKELLQTREEAYSPLTRRPMKEKLRAANRENDRLQKELASMREKFETEVKRTVEHTTRAELELKRKVRGLEDSMEEKDHTIRELQYQHEEMRLDNNIITSLKATIERLEQDKLDMEEINLGMNQRNDVLSKLLAMSPTKACDGFDLKSPVREKRKTRPISLILPRQPSSPYGSQYEKPASVMYSPRALNSADISPFRLSPDGDLSMQSANLLQNVVATPQQELSDPMNKIPSPVHQTKSRRSTLQSDISSSASAANGIASFWNEEKGLTRRKARRFMAGSTQLKPLLLPSMTSDNISLHSASTASSPRNWPARALSEVDADDTILPSTDLQNPIGDNSGLSKLSSAVLHVDEPIDEEGPGPAYTTNHETESVESAVHSKVHRFLDHVDTGSEFHSPSVAALDMDTHLLHTSGPELSVEHLKQHNSKYSLQKMPAPETPESLVVPPRPLFSANKNTATRRDLSFLPLGSPLVPPEGMWQVSVSKKRKTSLGMFDLGSASKIHRRHQSRDISADLASEIHINDIPRSPGFSTSTGSAKQQLSQIRSTDNFVNLLRQKNFAARPLAALTIRTVYTLLSTCTNAVREFRSDPFALARRVLANAWRSNWKLFGKVSWWVLGLFIQPEAKSKARVSMDWDQYDGESIASRYCSSLSDDEDLGGTALETEKQEPTTTIQNSRNNDSGHPTDTTGKPGWGHSMYLWGKFSAALVLAVGGAVIKGPSEMLKETRTSPRSRGNRHKHCKSCSRRGRTDKTDHAQPQTPDRQEADRPKLSATHSTIGNLCNDRNISDFDFRFQLDSSSLLEQLQQPDDDSTLRPETSRRGRVGSLFSPTPSSSGLVSKMQDLKLYSTKSKASIPETPDPVSHTRYGT